MTDLTDEAVKALLDGATPGPWTADETDPSDVVVWTSPDKVQNDELIANVGHRAQPVALAFDCDGPNARLMAAAPELARALLEARAECDGAHMIIATERAEVVRLRAEVARIRAEAAAFRMCVNCGLIVPASHDRAQPGPGCEAPDACTFDLTPQEAWEHWRAKAHQYRADAKAAVAMVVEGAAHLAWSHKSGIDDVNRPWLEWVPDKSRSIANVVASEIAAAIRALADTDALAEVEKLLGERDTFASSERELSAAYLRIRHKLQAWDTKPGGTDRFEVTEAALDRLTADLAVTQKSVATLQRMHTDRCRDLAAALAQIEALKAILHDAGALRDAADRVSEWFCTEAHHLEGPRIQALRTAMVAYDRHMQPTALPAKEGE